MWMNGAKRLVHEYQRWMNGAKSLVHEYQRWMNGAKSLVHEYQCLILIFQLGSSNRMNCHFHHQVTIG
ncbi:hypothetical protein A4S05_33895 [Nostoc sp. KVJ20]|nr:hypothetical protein A4S05_33895 [Nostoc sp. KVJ20]